MKTAVALVHIFFATVWLGGSFFYVVVLLPRLTALEPAARLALRRSLHAVMTPLLATSAAGTIVSGLVMMVQLHGAHPGSFSQSRWGQALIVGTLASVGALVVAAIAEAGARRADAAAAPSGGAAPDVTAGVALGADGSTGRSRVVLRAVGLALLVLALATMALARYS